MDAAENAGAWFKRATLVSFQSQLDVDDSDDHVLLTTKDLVCYAFQIARGMEFLASKKVNSSVCLFTALLQRTTVWYICFSQRLQNSSRRCDVGAVRRTQTRLADRSFTAAVE